MLPTVHLVLDAVGGKRFELQHQLGEGGFGRVYAAFDREMGIAVALKSLNHHHPTAIYHFKKEFRTLSGISHPNLVSLYELFQTEDAWYFTMELVAGAPLLGALRGELPPTPATVIDRTAAGTQELQDPIGERDFFAPVAPSPIPADLEPITLERLYGAFRQLAAGVARLHAAGVLHRDLKPSNVLLTPEDRVAILDFGLVTERVQRAADGESKNAGTPRYMAPEVLRGQGATEASDWFAVGVMLHQALTGRHPMPNPTSIPGAPEALSSLCCALLAQEPERRPDGAEVLRRLRALEPGGDVVALAETAAAPAIAPFVGRRDELARLDEAFAKTTRGGSLTLHVSGDSGIGKSSLCERFLDGAKRRGALVATGRCYVQESLPYKALDGVLDELTRHLVSIRAADLAKVLPAQIQDLARLFPVLRRVPQVATIAEPAVETRDSREIKRHAFAALRELLSRMSEKRPLILYIDDAQWGDADSAAVLHALMLPPRPPSILLLIAYRGDERTTSPFLRELATLSEKSDAQGEVERIELKHLEAADCRALVEGLLPSQALQADTVERVTREAGGNPLLLEQLSSFVAPGGDKSLPGEGDRRALLAGMISEQVAALPETWRRFLAVVSLAGHPLALESARKAADLEVLDRSLFNRMRAAHLIRSRGVEGAEQLAPYHDKIRETVVAGLDDGTRRQLHGSIGQALALSPTAPPRLIASHFRAAEKFEEAADYAYRAAEQAYAALAFEDAAELYGEVIQWSPGDAARRRELLRKHGDALASAGRCIAAAPVYLEAAEGAERLASLDLERRAFEQYYTGGKREEALEILGRLFRSVGLSRMAKAPSNARLLWDLLRVSMRGSSFSERAATEIDPEALFRIDLCYTASRTMLRRDSNLYPPCATRGLLLSLEAGEPSRVAEGLAQVGTVLAMLRPRAGAAMLDDARRLSERLGSPRSRGIFAMWSGMADLARGEWRSALAGADRALELLRGVPGVTAETQQAQLLSLITAQQLGLFDELRRRAEEALVYARDHGNGYVENYLGMQLAIPRLMSGDVDGARARLDQSLALFPRGDSARLGGLVWSCACDLYRGETGAALARIENARDDVAAIRMPRHPLLRATYAILQMSLQLQSTVEKKTAPPATIDKEVEKLDKIALPHIPGIASMLRAALAAARDDRPGAVGHCKRAVAGFERAGLVAAGACARRRLGQLTDGDEGRREIQAADEWMRAHGIAEPHRWTDSQLPGFAFA
jgi:serine/threonine protein kinase/tetratricopeptide (TPR) repeat protein